jgi:uncharacterized membrane protein
MNKNTNNKFDMKKISIIIVAAIAVVAIAYSLKTPNASKTADSSLAKNEAVKDSDIIIQTKDITETPTFYPASIDGVELEVLAVKASDGTIRTAFNTCQVCYNSGKGYYEVDGDELVCQNCGNRFGMDAVEVTKGGCNPVPITEEYKTVTDDTITISKDILSQATAIFAEWK